MKKNLLMRTIKAIHFLALWAAFIACWYLFYHESSELRNRFGILICGFYAVILYFLVNTYRAYSVGMNRISELLYGNALANILSAGIIYVLACLAWMRMLNPLPLLGLLVVQGVLCIAWAFAADAIYFAIHAPKETAIIYRNRKDLLRLKTIEKFPRRFRIVKTIENPSDDMYTLFAELEGCRAIFVAGIPATLRNALVKYCVEQEIDGYFAPHVGDVIMKGAKSIEQFHVPIMKVTRAKPHPEYLFIKRLVDVVASLIGIVLLSPLMLVCAIAIKVYDRGPVLYRQVRLTKDGKRFRILKFRTMRTDAEKDGVARLSTGEKDSRITPVGRFLRRFRLDELMQLFNILGGSMTLVGPRPERPEIAEKYEQEIPAFNMRLQVKAGLTGYAQVYGRYNSSPYDKLQMDLMYINQMTVLEDLKLIFATIKVLFLKDSTEGVRDGQTTAFEETDGDRQPEAKETKQETPV